MGQVPASAIAPLGLLGSGPAARRLLHSLSLLGPCASVPELQETRLDDLRRVRGLREGV